MKRYKVYRSKVAPCLWMARSEDNTYCSAHDSWEEAFRAAYLEACWIMEAT